MKKFLNFGRFNRECVKIQGGHGPTLLPLADAHVRKSYAIAPNNNVTKNCLMIDKIF